MSVDDRVREHFHRDATRFDAIYEDGAKSIVGRFIDNVWRGVVRRRLELTLDVLAPLAGKSVLDVGCGSGRFCIEYARRGAARVVGIDFAAAMIDLAETAARTNGVADQCEFHVGLFPEAAPPEQFDASTAMGFFDYVPEPVSLVAAMRERTRDVMAMSFPKAREWRAPVRRLRFLFNRCPLFLYTENQVRAILEAAGVTRYDLTDLKRDYFVVARP
jgi:2-polyprenyl-3-methyl-5-hydroxy-6-metoxy-1,4-benzoquinol methylase